MQAAVWTGLFGGLVGLFGGGIAFFNSYMGVRWKRAEIANSYVKDFNASDELVFAGRCLDWNGGKLVVPKNLQAYLTDGANLIEHDKLLYYKSISSTITIDQLNEDPRTQIYRTSLDTLLSWLSLVSSAIDRGVFQINDIEDAAYWVAKIESERSVICFLKSYGYGLSFEKLQKQCRTKRSNYTNWHFLPRHLSIDG